VLATGTLLFVLAIASPLAPVWRVYPGGRLGGASHPRLSFYECVRLHTLNRQARNAHRLGRWTEALAVAREATAANPRDLQSQRVLLEAATHLRGEAVSLAEVRQAAGQLAQLAGRRAVDVELVTRVLLARREYATLVEMAGSAEGTASPAVQAAVVEALFFSGRVEESQHRFQLLAGGASVLPARLQVFQTAYQAGWGGPAVAGSAWAQLRAQEPDAEVTAELLHRLRLRVAWARGDFEAGRESLFALRSTQEAPMLETLVFCRLLARIGQNEEALRLALGEAGRLTRDEGLDLAYFLADYGQLEPARRVVTRTIAENGHDGDLVLALGALLARAADYDRLLELAQELGMDATVEGTAKSVAEVLASVAFRGMGQEGHSQELFERALRGEWRQAALGAQTARVLAQTGHREEAQRLLVTLESSAAASPDYWVLRTAVAWDRRDTLHLRYASGRLLALRPGHPLAVEAQAVAAVVERVDAGQALEAVARLAAQATNQVHLRIHHADALVQNQRNGEAWELLSSLSPGQLPPDLRSQYWFVRADLECRQSPPFAVSTTPPDLDVSRLFPAQRRWYAKLQQASAEAGNSLPRVGSPVRAAQTFTPPPAGPGRTTAQVKSGG
jgi:tetratricopeptide (TPR) repeat protein